MRKRKDTATLSLFEDEEELESLREQEKALARAQKEAIDLPKKLERERIERERTMPPLHELEERMKLNQYEQMLATRKHYRNVMKAQTSSVLLLFMLVAATIALIAWSVRLMQG